jgi:hypothetical protein
MERRIRPVVIGLLGLASAISAGEARGEEFYDVMIFGSQSRPKLLQYTHTWATFIRAVGEGPDASNYALYQHTISWLPQSLDVRTWTILPEPGVNLDLYQTLNAVYHDREHVTMWGGGRSGSCRWSTSARSGSRRSSTAGGRNTGRSARRGTCSLAIASTPSSRWIRSSAASSIP